MAQVQANTEAKAEMKAQLVEEYRNVGPAAVRGALCCSKPKQEEPKKRSYQPREEA